MISIYFLILILCAPLKETTAKSASVLIYGIKLAPRPAFPTLTKEQFKSIVQEFLKSHTFFVILEEDFHARQISCQSKLTKEQCYPDFPESIQYTFFASVDDALEALEELFDDSEAVYVNKEGRLGAFELCEEGYESKLNIIQASEPFDADLKLIALRAEIMRDIRANLKYCQRVPLFIFAASIPKDIEYNKNGDQNTLIVKGISTTIVNGKVIVDVATRAHKMFEYNDSDVKPLQLIIEKKEGGWTKTNVIYEGETYEGKTLKWPKTVSFNTPGLIFTNGNKQLRINKLQFERFSSNENVTKHNTDEDDWYTCVYVTPGIMMGIVVVAMLGSIMYFGLTMILDIKTNDRFDGPEMQGLQFGTVEN